MQNYYLIGYSGHALVVAEAILANKYNLAGYYEQTQKVFNPFNIPYLGINPNHIELSAKANSVFFPAIGNNIVRAKIVNEIESFDLPQAALIHPNSYVSTTASIANSSFIAVGAVINSHAVISQGCIINSATIIEHECKIGKFCHVAPGAVLAGNVTLGENTFVGANAVIAQNISIGNNVTIGAGSVVIRDIPDNQTWVGNPAKKIK